MQIIETIDQIRQAEMIFKSNYLTMSKKKYLKILPPALDTSCFLWFTEYFMLKFKANNGYKQWCQGSEEYKKWHSAHKDCGRWLKEYQKMEAQGLFTPEQLQELYKPILQGTSKLSYIYWDAVNCICTRALDMAESFLSKPIYEIRTITRVIALDDNDRELTELSLNYARKTCKAMNGEAEEELFVVYNSKTKKPISPVFNKYPIF